MNKKGGGLKARHLSVHHIIPTSRDGPKKVWNEYQWGVKKHCAWHVFAANYFPSEVISLIRNNWTLPDGGLDVQRMGGKFYRAWQRVFSDELPSEGTKKRGTDWRPWSPRRAIKFIEDNLLPAEIRFFNEMREV